VVPLSLNKGVWPLATAAGVIGSLAVAGFFLPAWYLLAVGALAVAIALAALLPAISTQHLLLGVFVMVAWFPEFSQTDWDVYSAAEAPTLYNFRPLPGVTASIFDYLFAAVVIVWLLRTVLPEPRRLLRVPLGAPVLAFLGCSTLAFIHGIWVGNETYYVLRDFRVLSYFSTIYLMITTTFSGRPTFAAFVKILMTMAASVGVYGVIRFCLGMGKEFADVRIIYYDIADSVLLYIAMLGTASLLIFRVLQGKRLIAVLLIGVPIVFSFIFSFRRGAWLSFVCGLFFLVVTARQQLALRSEGIKNLKPLMLLAASFILSLALVQGPLRSFVMDRILSIGDLRTDSSNAFRVLDSLNAFATFLHHPVTGVGLGGRYEMVNYSEAVAPSDFWDSVSRTCHNGYLFLLYKMGLIGFVCYIAIFLSFFKYARQRIRSLEPAARPAAIAFSAVVLAMLINTMSEPFTNTLRPAVLLAFILGISVVTGVTSCSPSARRVTR
jgi:O-antigen ligase